jgi:antitoxin MazE
MVKHLTKHGNSLALVIEKPILDLLKIDATTPLEITTDGKSLTIRVPDEASDRAQRFADAMAWSTSTYESSWKRLAQ